MINHFHTWLLNRPAEFFRDSLFPVHLPADFRPSAQDTFTQRIDRVLFGESPDASLLDYRFFQFLHLMNACRLDEHLRRYDSRETYRRDEPLLYDETHFQPSIVPASGLIVTENTGRPPKYLRKRFLVMYPAEKNIPLTVFLDGDRLQPARMLREPSDPARAHIESLGLTLAAQRSGSWLVDYRVRPRRTVVEIVRDTLELSENVLWELFRSIKDTAPEYEEGFRTITDSLTKFCMVLFAQAIANQQRQGTNATKRLADPVGLSPDADGLLYYGSSPNERLRMADLKKQLQSSCPVRDRRQTVEIAAVSLGYLYLCWPVRFGLPPKNRIIVDQMLNSAWTISYTGDQEEQYVVLRSENKLRTETPIRIEIL